MAYAAREISIHQLTTDKIWEIFWGKFEQFSDDDQRVQCG